MKTALQYLCVLAVAASLAACGRDQKDVAEETADKMSELTSVLKKVDDTDSAKDLKGEIKDAIEDLKSLGREMEQMPEPESPEEARAMLEGVGQRLMTEAMKMQTEIMRIMRDPQLAAELQSLLQEAQNSVR